MEIKQLCLSNTEIKFGAEGSLKFSGYASVFGGVDTYGDTIVKGAYTETLKNRSRPVQLRWNHYGPVIGKYTNIYEDDRGLYVEGELTKGHSVAEDAAALLRHGAISGLSIGYSVPPNGYEMEGSIRKLKQIQLFEVSVVEEPADNAARIASLKSALHDAMELKEIEAILRRQAGLSQAESTAIVSAVKNAIKRGDRVSEQDALNTLKTFKLSI